MQRRRDILLVSSLGGDAEERIAVLRLCADELGWRLIVPEIPRASADPEPSLPKVLRVEVVAADDAAREEPEVDGERLLRAAERRWGGPVPGVWTDRVSRTG